MSNKPVPYILDAQGRPLTSSYKKEKPPSDKPIGAWSGPLAGLDDRLVQPGTGGVMGMNLKALTLDDFAVMRDHPQVNASLSVLAFMQHQSPWKIECDDKDMRDLCTEQIERIWTQLNRAMSQANWAGFSPSVLEWKNDTDNRVVLIDKVKDLDPRTCAVNWKEVDGWSPPGKAPTKHKIYDGIKQLGSPYPYPVENTFWYPVMMENGDYYGRRLLQAAFQPWYFSVLTHLYANRYYERYGEPTPMGRAPFDEDIDVPGMGKMSGTEFMGRQLQSLRNRSVVVLPNDGQWTDNKFNYDYQVSFEESMMRGADFERILERYDEEISLSLFTPVLLMRTADVGSYNLGQGHMQVYLWMMNAMNEDRAFYINKYILDPIVNYNRSLKAPRATIKFKKLGDTDTNLVKELLTALVNGGKVRPDLEQLGEMVGLTLKEVKETIAKTPAAADPTTDPATNPPADKVETTTTTKKDDSKSSKGFYTAEDIVGRIRDRVLPQIANVYENKDWDRPYTLGYQRELGGLFAQEGVTDPRRKATVMLSSLAEQWQHGGYLTASSLMKDVEPMLTSAIAQVLGGK